MRAGVCQAGGLCAGLRGAGEVVSGDVLFDDVGYNFCLYRQHCAGYHALSANIFAWDGTQILRRRAFAPPQA